jgi:hypothetical protein
VRIYKPYPWTSGEYDALQKSIDKEEQMNMPHPFKKREVKMGRPVGTTRAAGYKVSPGRPTGVLKGWKKFERNIVGGFENLMGPEK